jgi:4-amino-4-deoxy-L-arabinose transferase-like glycosyltransferase
MPYCSRCGVEVHDEARECPLCQSPIQQWVSEDRSRQPFPEDDLPPAHAPTMNQQERMRMAAFVTAFGLLIPVLVTLSVDQALNGRLTWSYYPLIILFGCLLLTLTALFSYRQPARIIIASSVIIAAILASLQAVYGLPAETTRLGIPLTGYAALSSYAAVTASAQAKRKGSNIAAYTLLAIAACCLASDITISHQLDGNLRPSWSLVILAATLPVALMLLYLHHRREYEARLKKYFHI